MPRRVVHVVGSEFSWASAGRAVLALRCPVPGGFQSVRFYRRKPWHVYLEWRWMRAVHTAGDALVVSRQTSRLRGGGPSDEDFP